LLEPYDTPLGSRMTKTANTDGPAIIKK